MNPFKNAIVKGRFILHWRYRFDALFGGGGDEMKSIPAQNLSKVAAPLTDAKGGISKQKQMASLMTQDWDQPILSKKGLLGL